MESIVRRGTPTDRDGIWSLMRMLHTENGAFNISEGKVNWILDRVLHPDRIPEGDMGLRGYIGVIGPSNALEGLVLMVIANHWYTEDFHLEELANFVHPNHRRGKNHARTLLSYSKHISDKVGIPLLMGVISNDRTEAKVRLYRKQLPEVGAYFLYGARTGRVGAEQAVKMGST